MGGKWNSCPFLRHLTSGRWIRFEMVHPIPPSVPWLRRLPRRSCRPRSPSRRSVDIAKISMSPDSVWERLCPRDSVAPQTRLPLPLSSPLLPSYEATIGPTSPAPPLSLLPSSAHEGRPESGRLLNASLRGESRLYRTERRSRTDKCVTRRSLVTRNKGE